MDDKKFNVSGDNNEEKSNKDQSSDFEFKIEKPKDKPSSQDPAKPERKELPEGKSEEGEKDEIKVDFSVNKPEISPQDENKQEQEQESAEPEPIPENDSFKDEPKIEKAPEAEEALEKKEEIFEEAPKLQGIKPEGSISEGTEKNMDNNDFVYVKGESESAPEETFKELGGGIIKKEFLPYAFFAIVALMVLISLLFVWRLSSAKKKIKENAILANKFAVEKDDIAKEKEELQAKIDDLEKNVALAKEVETQIYEEKEKLQKQLKGQEEYYTNKYSEEAESSLEKYTTDMKNIAKKVIELNKTYETDKKAYNSMEAQNKKLKGKMVKLDAKMKVFIERHSGQGAVFLYNLGVAYARGGLYDDAVRAFTDSLGLESNNPDAHYNLALLYETSKRDTNKAIEHYQKYLSMLPDSIERYDLETKIDSLKRVCLQKEKYPIVEMKSPIK